MDKIGERSGLKKGPTGQVVAVLEAKARRCWTNKKFSIRPCFSPINGKDWSNPGKTSH